MPRFVTQPYQTNNGSFFKCKIEASTGVDAVRGPAAVPPATGLTEDMTVRISKNNREAGIQPRHVILSRTIGTEGEVGPGGLVNSAKAYKRVIVTAPAGFGVLAPGSDVTIGGVDYEVVRYVSEEIV